jgi:hypothetical protein
VFPEPTKEKMNALPRFMNTVSKKRGAVRAVSSVRDILFRAQTALSGDPTESFDCSKDKRAVRFTEDPSTHYTLSRDDYMSEEMQAVFLQSKEFRKVHGDCLKQIRKMKQGKTLKEKKCCATEV